MARKRGYYCATCGKHHDELPMSFGFAEPLPLLDIPKKERRRRCEHNDEICMIDGKEFFIRGCLEVPVHDHNEPFVWGVWVSLSEKNFKRTINLWETPGRESEAPYFGWFSNRLPIYPETVCLKMHVHTRPVGKRPRIELEPTDHPLAVDQREGITMARVHEIVEQLQASGALS
jgi:hypothetical protein